MDISEAPQDAFIRVLFHPLPNRAFPFDAVRLRELFARCVSLSEEEKIRFIDRFLWISADQAADVDRFLAAEHEIVAARNEAMLRRLRFAIFVVMLGGPVGPAPGRSCRPGLPPSSRRIERRQSDVLRRGVKAADSPIGRGRLRPRILGELTRSRYRTRFRVSAIAAL